MVQYVFDIHNHIVRNFFDALKILLEWQTLQQRYVHKYHVELELVHLREWICAKEGANLCA